MGNEASSEQKDTSCDIPLTKEDIASILFDKVNAITNENTDLITGMLLEMPDDSLQVALTDETFLRNRINEAIQSLRLGNDDKSRREVLGDDVYFFVQTVYPDEELAAKLTGMLLEMDEKLVRHLIKNKTEFRAKIHEAANVLKIKKSDQPIESQTSKSVKPTKDEIGELIFDKLLKWQIEEEEAAKFTGMILEMDENDIIKIVNDDILLKHKIDEAQHVLKTTT